MVMDDRQRLEPCAECGRTFDCLCRCRARIRAVAVEIDAMATVVDAARVAIGCFRRDAAPEEIALRNAIDALDEATIAREAIP